MTLNEWELEHRLRLEHFVSHWLEQHTALAKECYPLEMDPGDWDEQFEIWEDWYDATAS